MPEFIDQTGRTVFINGVPRRIISLVPSQTELLYDLGLQETVVGITKFCIHPQQWFREKKRVGGTKAVDMNAVRSLQPDLIIANKEENEKEQVEELALHYPVWISDIHNLSESLDMIAAIADITDKGHAGAAIIEKISANFTSLNTGEKKLTVAYLIWQDPYMSIGGDTFIHNMLEHAGFENVFADRDRYPIISMEDLKVKKPHWLLLSSEPFPFDQKHQAILQQQLPSAKVVLVDGEMFSWYGSRLLHAPAYFKSLEIDDC